MKISIVIPNYNGEELLRKNLQKVCESAAFFDSDVQLVIVDDGSEDNSVVFIKEFKRNFTGQQDILLIESKENKGFSSTVNEGVDGADGDIVILLNTDVVPSKNFISPLVSHFKDDKVFAVGCMDESIEGEKTVLRGRGIGAFRRGFLLHKAGGVDKENSLWVSGGSGAFRKSAWEKLGGMDPVFNPFYWEDIDLSYRAQKAGYSILFEKESIVKHEHEKGIIKKKYSSKKIKENSYRNQIFFVWLNITDSGLVLSHIFWLPYHLTVAILRGDLALPLGFFSALMRLPGIISQRRKRAKTAVLTDAQVFQPFAKEYEGR